MKNPTALRHVSIAGNIDQSQTVAMGMDEDGMDVLMSLLSNMYSNGHLAVVREYSCNALDSHVEAGTDRPIEIKLPTFLDPQFQVQDYGVGLSHDEILRVYSRYGASTKRDSNKQIGAFGIGAKSAFTVGNTFTVTGIKDGEKTIAMFALTREGKPTVTILHRGDTDEANGVTVDVGVENVNAVVEAAKKLFSCWKPGTVLVDGAEPKHIWGNVEELAHSTYLDWNVEDTYNKQAKFRLIMGGVPYLIPDALWNELPADDQQFRVDTFNTKIGYIWDTPIGSVDIAPNREELRITPRTKATIKRLLDITRTSLNGWMAKKLDECENIWQAKQTYNLLVEKLAYKADPTNVYWKSVPLGPATITFNADDDKVHTAALERRGYSSIDGRNYRVLPGSTWYATIDGSYSKVLFVTNVPESKINLLKTYAKSVLLDRGQGENLIVGIEADSIDRHWFSVGPDKPSNLGWIDFKNFWEHGKRLRKLNSGSSKIKTQYLTRVQGDTGRERRTIDDMLDLDPSLVLYTDSYGNGFDLDNPIIKEAWVKDDILVIFKTSQQSLEVLKRFFPEIQHFRTYFSEKADRLVAALTSEDHRIMRAAAQQGEMNLAAFKFVKQHRDKITNKAVLKNVDDFEATNKLTQADSIQLNYLQRLYRLSSFGAMPYQDDRGTAINFLVEKLPLLNVTLRNSWSAAQMCGGEKKLNQALIDYINVTPI